MKLLFYYLNFCSIASTNKQSRIKEIIRTLNPDVILITESWLKDDVRSGEDPQIAGYCTVAKDSRITNTVGGGVCVIAKSHITTESISVGIPNKNFHIQCAKFKIYDQLFALVYREPKTEDHDDHLLFDFLAAESEPMISIGDFNLEKIDWNAFTAPPSQRKLLKVMDEKNWVQLIEEPTHRDGNVLDIIITPDPNIIFNVDNSNEKHINFGYAHHALTFQMDLGPKSLKKEEIEVEDYKNADYKKLRLDLKLADWQLNNDVISLNEYDVLFRNNLTTAWGDAIPTKKVTIDPEAISYMSAITKKERNHLRKMKKKASQMKIKSAHLIQRIIEQSQFVNELEISDMKNKENKILYGAGELKTNIFKHLETFNNKRDSKPGPLIVGGTRANSDEVAAEFMRNQYLKVATEQPVDEPRFDEYVPSPHPEMREVVFKNKWIRKEIKKMRTRTAPGHDGIKVAMLKQGINEIVDPLKKLFKLSYENGKIPDSWRIAIVTPLYKSGKRSDPANYRPISVISNLFKLMEKVVCSAVNHHMKIHNIWSDTQFAFRDGSSVVNNLISHDLKINEIIDRGGQVTIILVDARKAYDLIGFNKILRGMKRANLPKKLMEWTMDALQGRSFQVKVGKTLSRPATPNSGVLQGSAFSPTLFNLAMEDLHNAVEPDCSLFVSIKQFADDDTFAADTTHREGILALKKTLARFDEKCKETDIFIHPDKTQKIVIGKTKCHDESTDFMLAGKVIKEVDSARDLGVLYNKKYSNSNHFQTIYNKLHSRVMWIKKRLWNRDIKYLTMIWNALCGSIITFGLASWGRPTRTQIQKLQGLQRTFFLDAEECTNCEAQIQKKLKDINTPCSIHVGPEPMDKLIMKTELKMCFDIHRGHMRINGTFCRYPNGTTRSTSNYQVQKIPGTSPTMAQSFAHRAITLWNALPLSVRNWHVSKAVFAKSINHKVPWLEKPDRYRQEYYDWKATNARIERLWNDKQIDIYCHQIV